MKIEVDTSQNFSAYDQFDPLILKTVQFFDVGCLGGTVKVRINKSISHFICTACGTDAYEGHVECRSALRRLLISGEPQQTGRLKFVVRGKSPTSPSAT